MGHSDENCTAGAWCSGGRRNGSWFACSGAERAREFVQGLQWRKTNVARPPKRKSAEEADPFLIPSREYWRQINREQRQADAAERARRKAADKKRRTCRCAAYPWPHRPNGGLCRWPDPPAAQWQPKAGRRRPYRGRYAGVLRQLARGNGLHPIRDRDAIAALGARVLAQARQLKRQHPRLKYRNMEVTAAGVVVGRYQTAGPMM